MINKTAFFVAANDRAEAMPLLKEEFSRYVDGDRWLPEIAEIAIFDPEGWLISETTIIFVEDWLKEMGIRYRVFKE